MLYNNNDYYVLHVQFVSVPVHVFCPVLLTDSLSHQSNTWDQFYCCPYLIDEETEDTDIKYLTQSNNINVKLGLNPGPWILYFTGSSLQEESWGSKYRFNNGQLVDSFGSSYLKASIFSVLQTVAENVDGRIGNTKRNKILNKNLGGLISEI